MNANQRQGERIGVLVGGGPAPGINGVIHAVTIEAARHHCEVFGIYEGFKYLMEGELRGSPLTPSSVGYIYMDGGSILHTSRANPTKSASAMRACVETLTSAGISALISVGGDDTAFSASRVAKYAQETMGIPFRSVHVPKTIDNDLPLPEDISTFGFETAREVGARLIMNLKKDAMTARHWFLVLSMGRKAGHLALGIGNSGMATVTMIPEEWGDCEIRLQEVVDVLVVSILMRMLVNKSYGVALLAEGILENLSHEDLQFLDNVERDEHGHIRLAEVNFLDILKESLDHDLDKLGVNVRLVKHVLGYELRCAQPCAFDIEYTRSLGEAAVDYLVDGGTNAIITIQRNEIVPIPYEEMLNPLTGRTDVRMVNVKSFRYRSAYNFMTRLKPEHADDDDLFARLAGLTNLTTEEFKTRYNWMVNRQFC